MISRSNRHHKMVVRFQGRTSKANRTNNADVMDLLEQQLQPFQAIIDGDWFDQTPPYRLPVLLDYLTLEQVERRMDSSFQPRIYDEKFAILCSPNLFISDLRYFRERCELRRRPVAVGFLDIDDFKSFNTVHGETTIDRSVLPLFMAALESHVFNHGYAYRFGGDEYAVIFPNACAEDATRIFSHFQEHLQNLEYRGVEKRTSVSIGVAVASDESYLTERELLQKAEEAKNFVKKRRKGSIAGYETETCRANELCFLRESSIVHASSSGRTAS